MKVQDEGLPGNSVRNRPGSLTKIIAAPLVIIGLIVGLYVLSRHNYPLFHSFADGVTCLIATGVFIIVWSRRRLLDNQYYLFIGIAFLFFAFWDFLHLLGNKSMGVFPQYGNLGPALYIVSRYIISISFLISTIFIKRKVNPAVTLSIYSAVTVFILLSIFYWQNFPLTFIEGTGLTPFKVISDYVICGILAVALLLLCLNRRSLDARVYKLVAASIILSIATGLAFTLYTDPFGVTNAVAHFFQIASFYLIYEAFMKTVVTKPQDILYRNLNESEQKYRNLFNNMAEEVHFWKIERDHHGKIKTWRLVDANPPTLKTWERNTVEEIRGKTTDEIFGPGSTEHFMPVVQKVMSEGVPYTYEDFFPNLNKYFRFTTVPFGDYFITTGADITLIKQTQEALKASEEQAKAMIKYAPTGIYELDYRGPRIISVNDAMCSLSGYSREEFLSMNPMDTLVGESKQLFAQRLIKQLAGEKIPDNVDFQILKKDGSIMYVNLNVSISRDKPNVALVIGHDITERKQAEEALRESEEKYRLLYSTTMDGFVRIRMDGTIIECNPAYNAMLGYSDQELKSLTYFDLTPAKWIDFETRIVEEQIIKWGYSDIYEKEYRRKDGIIIPVELRTYLNRNKDGQPAEMWAMVRDITKRKMIEYALRESEERYRRIVETADEGIATHDLDGNITYVNQRMADMLGYAREETIGKASINFVDAEEKAAVVNARLSNKARGHFHSEWRMRRRDGSELWTLANITSRLDAAGNFIGYLAMHTDITERKKAEIELKNNARKLNSYVNAINNSDDAILTTSADLRIQTWNKGAEAIFGWNAEEAIGQLSTFMASEYPYTTRQAVFQQIQSAGSWSGEVSSKKKDGTRVSTLATVSLLHDENGKDFGYTAVHHDITERKKADELKDEFIGMVSHELKTPITVVLGALATSTDPRVSPDQARELLNDAINQAVGLGNIVDNLLELSRKQSGRLIIKADLIDIRTIIKDVIKKLCGKSSIHRLVFDDSASVPAIMADPFRLERILINLMDNAIKYSPEGGDVIISTRVENNELIVGVQDFGLGISAENQPKLFQSFERLGVSIPGGIQGIGLGLRVSKALVEAHNGRMWLESEPGKGSTFYFSLPIA